MYFIADWLEIHFLFTVSLPFYAFVFTLAENVSKKCLEQSLMKILLREREVLKQLKKILAQPSVCSTGATLASSVNATEFWQRQTRPP